MGRVQDKVALITGAGRGQGRNHAARLAAEGAHIIAVDLCGQIPTVPYALATRADLDETVAAVVAHGRRIVTSVVDVRDLAGLTSAVAEGVAELGRLDVVVANAGIAPLGDYPPETFLDVVQVNLNGVINTASAALPHLSEGGSFIAIGSTASLHMGVAESGSNPTGPGGAGYGFSKRVLASFVHSFGREAGRVGIRVNAVHPSNVASPMLLNEMMFKVFAPEVDFPTLEDADAGFRQSQLFDVPYMSLDDISDAVLFLASDESRMVTGLQLKVDGGGLLKAPYTGV